MVESGSGPRVPSARHQLVFVDRLVATLIHLRHDLPHSVLGLLFGVGRSSVTRAIGEVRRSWRSGGARFPTVPVCGCGR
ncbi:hypothetical protein STENM36S_01163 [Streptomyces tendae]